MAFELALQISPYVWVMTRIQKIAKCTLGKSDLVGIQTIGEMMGVGGWFSERRVKEFQKKERKIYFCWKGREPAG